MTVMAYQITSLTIVYSTIYSGANQRKNQSSAPLAFVRGIHRWPVNSPQKGPVTRKMFSFEDVVMLLHYQLNCMRWESNTQQWSLAPSFVIVVEYQKCVHICMGCAWYPHAAMHMITVHFTHTFPNSIWVRVIIEAKWILMKCWSNVQYIYFDYKYTLLLTWRFPL